MSRKGFRWEYVALAAALTLAVLSLAYYLYQNVGVRMALERALLADPDVDSARIFKDGGTQVVEVALRKAPDLSVVYARLYSMAKHRMGDGAFRLQVNDRRDSPLQETYYSIHYYLEEASVRGNFGSMIEACSGVLYRAGISDYKITVDKQRIFVQIARGESYLYQVLDRSPGGEGGALQ
jgi:hypothetical protein